MIKIPADLKSQRIKVNKCKTINKTKRSQFLSTIKLNQKFSLIAKMTSITHLPDQRKKESKTGQKAGKVEN